VFILNFIFASLLSSVFGSFLYKNESNFSYFLFIKAELEQGSDKPPIDVVLCVFVDMSVFRGSNSDSLAVML